MASEEMAAWKTTWIAEVEQWSTFMFNMTLPKHIMRKIFFWIDSQVQRYGTDGMGDKPPEMPVATYWLQHIDSDAGYRVWREIQDYVRQPSASEGTSNPAPKKRAKAQASAAEGPPNPAPKKKAKAAAAASKAPEI